MSEKRRILYLVTSSGWGGAERYVSVLSKEAMTLGEVHVIAGPGDGTLFERLPHLSFVMRSRHLKRRISPIADILTALEIRSYLKKNAIDLIHANSTKSGLIAALAVFGMRRRPRIIYTAHGWAFLELERSWLFRLLTLRSERFASRRRDATIVLSEMERRVALEHGLADEAHLHLIPLGVRPSGVDFLPRNMARNALGMTDADGFVFGTIANVYPPKSLSNLVSAFDRIASERPNARLIVIGDGPSMSDLRDRARRSRHKDRITLTGHLPDAARLLKAFDVFVLPSSKEGMPWGILEASEAGLPILATRVGALPEMVRDGETGLLVPPSDVPALAEAMARIHDDKQLREKLKDGAPRIAESRPEELMVRKTLRVYWAVS